MSPQTYLARLAAGAAKTSRNSRDQLQGLAVLGVTFESGHVLALRHFEQTSDGPGFTAVWMREPNGDWHFFSTNPPERSCAFYMAPELADQTPIALKWLDAQTLKVEVPAVRLHWVVEFGHGARTSFLSSVIQRTPAALLRTNGVSAAVSLVARTVLRSGFLRLAGEVPNGQQFRAIPRQLWDVSASNASVTTYDFGRVVRPGIQENFGDFFVPAAPIAMAGTVEFSPLPAQLPAGGELAAAA